MIRTILVDDEPHSISILEKLLEHSCPEVSVIGKAEGVDTAFQMIREANPDLVFLDIEMIHGNAFDLLNRLQPFTFQIIFVTAFDKYAIRAFKYSAVDYLLKPINARDLRDAVGKVNSQSGGKIDMNPIKMLLENVRNLNISGQRMAIPTLNGLSFVPVNDIIRFEAQGHYTRVYLNNGESLLTTRDIKEFDDLLPNALFFRIHASHLVNLQKIQKYQKGRGGYVIMEDGASIEVANRRREEFLQLLFK